jgi:ankyrin repeat protein
MPLLLYESETRKDQYTNLSRKQKVWEQPLNIDWRMTADLGNRDYDGSAPLSKFDDGKETSMYKTKDWKYLYKNPFDKILHPAAVNNHYEYVKLYVEWGSEINTQDFQGWTPLHCAAHSGNIEIIKFL